MDEDYKRELMLAAYNAAHRTAIEASHARRKAEDMLRLAKIAEDEAIVARLAIVALVTEMGK